MGTKRIEDIHAALAIKRAMEVRREEYLDYMTFRSNDRPLFTEIFGPMPGLKEEWVVFGDLEEVGGDSQVWPNIMVYSRLP